MPSDSLSGDIDSAVDSAVTELSSGQPANDPAPSADAKSGSASPALPATQEPRATGSDVSTDRKADAPTTAAPVAETKPQEPSTAPPQEKWETVLSNARQKASAETEARLRQDYGIPTGADIAQVRRFVTGLHTDPIAIYRELGRALAPYLPETQPAKETFTRPTPRLRAEDGTAAYAAEDVDAILAHFQQQQDQRLADALQPIEAERERQASAAIWSKAVESADQILAEAKTWDGFDELKPEIVKLMEADGRVTFESAYNKLVQPWRKEQDRKLKETMRTELLKEIKTAPAVGQSIVPGAPVHAGTRSKRGRSFDSDVSRAVERAFAAGG